MDKKYTVTDHNDGKKYDITEHIPKPALDPNGYPIFPEKTTAELIAEARKLFQKPNPIPVKTKKEQELERRREEWERYYKDNEGKIPRQFPKTFFDKNEE